MDTEKVIVVMLLIAILLSVVTLTVAMSKDVVPRVSSPAVGEDVGTASVILNIVENPERANSG